MKINTTILNRNKIKTIYAIKNRIEMEPPYQRNGGLWNIDKKQKFLDSIVSGLDVPKLYFHEYNANSKKSKNGLHYAVIDGKQRLETIWEFIENKFPLGDFEILRLKTSENLKGLFYQDLSPKYLGLKSLDVSNFTVGD